MPPPKRSSQRATPPPSPPGESQNRSPPDQSAPDQSADGSINRPFGGPPWNPPEVDKDGRVGHPVMATQAMYGTPGPGRYTLPVIPDAPESTMKRAPTWVTGEDASNDVVGSIGVGPAGYDQDPNMTRKGKEDGRHYTIYERFPELQQLIPPPPYAPTEPSVLKHHVSIYPREPNWSIQKCYLERTGKYIPGPNYYPMTRFPKKLPHKTPQKGPDPVVSHKPNLVSQYVAPVGPADHTLPEFSLTRLRSNAPQYTIRRRDVGLKEVARSPGPAAYGTRNLDTVKNRVPSYSFGISGSPYVGSMIESFGKPGRPKNKQAKVCAVPPRHGAFNYGKDV